tara:strand:+ start:17624 stop:22687 length:5064 start_codon:yes stop_codon:yes gene_type:complete
MASLDDFNQTGPKPTLDNFQIQGPMVPVSNKPSNRNIAAHTAALSQDPESVEATYLRTSVDLDRSADSKVAKEVAERARFESQMRNRKALVGILSDPELSDVEKAAATNEYMNEQSSLYNLRDIVATEALIQDSEEDETNASENARINFASALTEVNESQARQLEMLNNELSSQDPNMVELGVGFLELLAPYAEQAITENVLEQARGGDKTAFLEALTAMGNAKSTLPEMLKKVPYSEREALTRTIIDAVNENSSIVFPDENSFAKMDFLRTALEEGYYGDSDRWIDNIVSVADLAVPFAPFIGRGLKWANRVRKGISSEGAGFVRGALETGDVGITAERAVADRPYIAAEATDAELRAAEDGAEADAADRALRAQEDASEQRLRERRAAQEQDPVRRGEDAATARREARRAVQGDTTKLRAMEDAAEKRAEAIKKGGAAARMTDEDLIAAERAYELEVARKRHVQSDVKPVTLSQTYRNTNPGKARVANQLVGEDTSGQAAQALYGTNRTEAVVHDAAGEVRRSDDLVRNKVAMPDAYTKQKPQAPNPRVMDLVNDAGAINLGPAERTRVLTRVINDFNNAAGVVTRNEMTVPKPDDIGSTTRIGVTYGPRDNGWTSGADAVETVKASLRDYGVRDSDITLMSRVGDDYAPVKVGDAEEGGDYLVQVDFPFTISASDFKEGEWDELDVFYNLFDRVPHVTQGRSGSFQRHILDAHSMLHPNITLGANVSVDRAAQLEKQLIQLSKGFADKYNKLGKRSQVAVEREIKRANKEGYNRTDSSLRADGFGTKELESLKDWRQVWDTMYWLENQDMVKTLRNRNYKAIEDPASDTRLYGKELARNQAGPARRVYNTTSGEMENLEPEDLKALYEKGGSVAELRSPMVMGEEAVKYVKVTNSPGGTIARRLRDDDMVLNYREGYYTVYYQDPKFVDKIVRDSRGNILKRQAVATAGDTSSANRMIKKLQEEAEPGVEYVRRDSKERLRLDSDDNWNLQEAQGRTAQRVRGERLEDATSPITDEGHNHVLGPVDALQRSARNISTRVPMRDYLETAKQRAISQYGHMFPKDKFGRPQFPDSSTKIKADEGLRKEAADARTTVEYLNSLEHGYINQIDETIKNIFRAVADAAGKKNLSLTERAFNFMGEHGGPTKLGRGTAFVLYLALNPVRQLIVQGHQAVQLTALHPRYVTTRLATDVAAMMDMKVGGKMANWSARGTGRSKEELKEMFEAYESSGLSASIDKSNLVRGTLSEIADSTSAGAYRRSPVARAVGMGAQGVAISRKAGFDAGEEINMLTSWLAHYDMAKRDNKGRALSKTQQDMVTAKARSYTYNMNRAGDMPYNENFLGMVFQFMQVPHKALLQTTTNRNLTKAEKARLATFNLAMYGGVPGTAMTAWFSDWLPEEREWREAVLQGMEGYMFNKVASLMYEEDVSIDYSSLAATDQTGLLEFVTQMFTEPGKLIAESPSTSLLFGSNPRITQFARTTAEYFHFVEPKDNNPVTTMEFLQEFGKLSSGFSNAMKARVVLKTGQKISSSGNVVADDLNAVEGFAAAAGLPTLEESRKYWLSNEMYEKSQSFESDVKEWYRQVKYAKAREGITVTESDFYSGVLNLAAENFKDTPKAFEIIQQQLKWDIERNNDDSLHKSVLRAFEWMDPNDAKEIVRTAPFKSEEARQQAADTLEYVDKYRNEE